MKNTKKLLVCLFAVSFLVTSCGKIAKLENGKEAVVTVKDGEGISVDDLYTEMKDKYALSILLDMIDEQMLEKIYPADDDEKSYTDSQVELFKYYYETYYSTGYNNFEEYLFYQYGVQDEAGLREGLSLSYKRDLATKDYAKKQIKDKEIEKYYKDEIIGDIEASHILIKAEYKDGANEDEIKKAKEEAKKKAEELIKTLNKAKDTEIKELFAKLAKENSSDGSAKDGGNLGWFNKGDMVQTFEQAAIKLKVNEYTKEVVESEYGYHIILKTGQKDKPKLEEVKEEIIDALVTKLKTEDKKLQYKALIALRDEKGVKIEDTELKKQYKTYVENNTKDTK